MDSILIVRVILIGELFYVCKNFVLFRAYLFVRALLGKTLGSRHGKPGRTQWSRFGRDPYTAVARVAGVQSFFPAGGDNNISLVSVRETLFCTYVPLKCHTSIYVCPFNSVVRTHRQYFFAS